MPILHNEIFQLNDFVVSKKEKNHALVLKRLEHSKDTYLTVSMARSQTILVFIQSCILPRCLFSAPDAIYCAKYALLYLFYDLFRASSIFFLFIVLIYYRFVQLLVRLGTPYFSMLQYFDRVLKELPFVLFACTENEATRIGRFLNETLALLSRYYFFFPWLALTLQGGRMRSYLIKSATSPALLQQLVI